MTTTLDEIIMKICKQYYGYGETRQQCYEPPKAIKEAILSWIEKEILGEWPNKCSDCRTQMIERLRK